MLSSISTVFTSLTVLWARVEFQTLRYAPWYTLGNDQTPRRDVYDLDYSSMLIHKVLFRSFRNRHHLVFLATVVSVALRVMTVLSPSIFTTDSIEQTSTTQIQVLDAFVTESLGYNITGNVTSYPWHGARAIHELDMVAPFGAGLDFAYQTFGTLNPGGATRATVDEPLDVVVDGLFMNMTCLGLDEYNGPSRYELGGLSWLPDLNLTLNFEGCEQSFSVRHDFDGILAAAKSYGTAFWQLATKLRSKNGRPCTSLPQQHEQFIYWGAHAKAVNESEPYGPVEIDKVNGVICSPQAWLSKVQVVDDGLSPTVTPIFDNGIYDDDGTQVPVDVNMWDLLVELISGMDKWVYYELQGRRYNYSPTGPLAADRNLMGLGSNASDPSIYDNAVLSQAIANLTSKIGPLIGHSLLREQKTSTVEGLSTIMVDKLLVSLGVGVTMIVISVLCFSAALWILLRFKAIALPWHRDPATLLGTMTFLHGCERQGEIRTSFEDPNSLKEQWANNSFIHLPLRLWARLAFLLFGSSILIGLLVSLDTSHRHNGLSTIDETTGTARTSSILWKSVPTLAVVCVSLYVGSLDTVVRGLSLLARLSERPCESSIVDLSLRDMIGVSALYHSLRLRIPAVSITQTLAIFCGFLTVLSSVLFDTRINPEVSMMKVEPKSWFGGDISGTRFDEIITRETFEAIYPQWNASNITYPRDTYRDIMFPATNIEDLKLEDAGFSHSSSAGTVVDMTLPGARLASTCLELQDTQPTLRRDSAGIHGNFTQSFTCPNGTILVEQTEHVLVSDSAHRFFAREIEPLYMDTSSTHCRVEGTLDFLPPVPWQLRTYVWGAIESPRTFEHLSAWRCNHSWVEVTTDVRYVPVGRGGFAIDNSHPPRAREDAKDKPWNPPFSVPNFDRRMRLSEPPNWPGYGIGFIESDDVSFQFQSLLQPFGTLRLADLGRKEMDAEVLDAMKKNIAFVGAQVASVEQRYALNETYLSAIDTNGKLEPLEAIVQNTRRQRLVQNEVITYIIVGILALVIAANLWALLSSMLFHHLQASRKHTDGSIKSQPPWVLDFELRGTAPEGFESISKIETLLHGSNFTSFMPDNAYMLTESELHRHLTRRHFRLGWFFNNRAWETVYTVGATDDEDFNAIESCAVGK